MFGVKVTNTKQATVAFDAIERMYSDEDLLAEAMMEAAEPVAEAMRNNIRKFSGDTARQITVWRDKGTEVGRVRILVGVPGPSILGKISRSYIARFLEFGTSKMTAKVWARTAHDAEGGQRFTARLVTILRSSQRAA